MHPGRARRSVCFASLALTAGLGTCALGAPYDEASTAQAAVSALGIELSLALLAFAGAALSPASLYQRLGLGPGRLSRPLVAVLLAGALALSSALDGALDLTGLREHSVLPELDAHLVGIRGGELAIALLGFGIAPGVAEELLCRGFLQRGLERSFGAPAAIALAALAFGALHIDPVHGAVAAVLGVYFGIVCWLGGGIRTATACHVLNNLAAVVTTAWGLGADLHPPLAISAGLAVASAALWAVWRRAGPPRGARGDGGGTAREMGSDRGAGLQDRPGLDDP